MSILCLRRSAPTQSIRLAVDCVVRALALHDLSVDEFLHPDEHRSVDYLTPDCRVVATWDEAYPKDLLCWYSKDTLSPAQVGLVVAHSSLFAELER